MPFSPLIKDYVGNGLAAARPVTPNVAGGVSPFYYATDTATLSFWTGAAWQNVAGASIAAQDEGLPLTSALALLNFTGAGVTATNVGPNVTVNIPGGGGGGAFGEFAYRPPVVADFPTDVVAAGASITKVNAAGKGLILRIRSGASGRAAAAMQTLPSTPFTASMRFTGISVGGPTQIFGGFCLRNSSNGRCVMIIRDSSGTGSVALQNWSNVDTFNSTVGFANLLGASADRMFTSFYLAVNMTAGGAITAYYSFDGATWTSYATSTAGAYLTAIGGSVDQLGIYWGATAGVGNGVDSLIPYWRVDAIDPPALALS